MQYNLDYIFHSGKNSKFAYYAQAYSSLFVPRWFWLWQRDKLLNEISHRPDRDCINQRINYYCTLNEQRLLDTTSPTLGEQSLPRRQKVYYFDSRDVARYFDSHLRWELLPGDITYVPTLPSLVKSRPLGTDVSNSTLLNMDKVRHFIFIHDSISWEAKQPKAIFRGKVAGKESRMDFMRKYFGSSFCDCGDVSRCDSVPREWQAPKTTLAQHLTYRYIISLEGNDVASNLKWVMSSNSIAIMPHPTCESWFMEGTLIPDYHYIEIRSDYSDLEERMAYYNAHPQEALAIIEHAHQFVKPFLDAHRERLIALGVMNKYLQMVNP